VYEQVLIPAAVRAALAGHAASIKGCETGGILLGYPLDDTTLRVSRASPPGPRARHSRFSFSRDTRFLQRYLDTIHDRSEGREDYVGEWHVHPALDAPPSRTDRRSLWRIARRKNYTIDNPVLLIVEQMSAQRRYRAYGFVVKPKRIQQELKVVLPAAVPDTGCTGPEPPWPGRSAQN
jgi:integrative and conjugative element protein (TIGR02256 family)